MLRDHVSCRLHGIGAAEHRLSTQAVSCAETKVIVQPMHFCFARTGGACSFRKPRGEDHLGADPSGVERSIVGPLRGEVACHSRFYHQAGHRVSKN